jgi:hypothetical protein
MDHGNSSATADTDSSMVGWKHNKYNNTLNPTSMIPAAAAGAAAGSATHFDPSANQPIPEPRNYVAQAPKRASSGHYTLSGGTQNQGNVLGDRSCVRQSKLYRQYESGNSMKAIFGHDHLAWDTNKKEGAYAGQQSLYDHETNSFITEQNKQMHRETSAGAPSRQADPRQRLPQPNVRPGTADKRASYDALRKPTCPW